MLLNSWINQSPPVELQRTTTWARNRHSKVLLQPPKVGSIYSNSKGSASFSAGLPAVLQNLFAHLQGSQNQLWSHRPGATILQQCWRNVWLFLLPRWISVMCSLLKSHSEGSSLPVTFSQTGFSTWHSGSPSSIAPLPFPCAVQSVGITLP